MPVAPKIILHCPVSDEILLEKFVEQWLREGVSLIAVVGPGCERIEDLLDEIVIGDGSDPNRFLCTSSHPNEPLADVINMLDIWDSALGGAIQQVRV